MANKELLRRTIDNSGLKIGFIAKKLDMSRPTLYDRLNNPEKFTGEQIVFLSRLLRLGPESRDKIFFS